MLLGLVACSPLSEDNWGLLLRHSTMRENGAQQVYMREHHAASFEEVKQDFWRQWAYADRHLNTEITRLKTIITATDPKVPLKDKRAALAEWDGLISHGNLTQARLEMFVLERLARNTSPAKVQEIEQEATIKGGGDYAAHLQDLVKHLDLVDRLGR